MRRVLALYAALAPWAQARAETAALASRDPALARSLRTALAPKGIRVKVVGDEPPPRTGDVLAYARAVSAREDAAAVVWVADAGDGSSTLLVFDRDVDRVLQRPLAWAPPFGAEQAIAAARTVRTMLRALRVTPDVDVAPPLAIEAPRLREAAARAATVSAPPAAPSPEGRLALETGGGARLGGADAAGWRLTAGLAVHLSPVAVAATGSLGGEDAVRAGGFAGAFRDDTVGATVRSARFAGPLLVEPGLGAALHLTRLTGELDGGGAISERRFDPALRAQTFVGIRPLDLVEVGVSLTVDGLVRRQRYLMGDDEVLSLPSLQGAVDLLVRLRGW